VASPPADRDIHVSISGMRFGPAHFEVRVGETIRFVVTNPNDVPHELFMGTMAEQLAHHREVMNEPPDQQVLLMQHTGYGIYLIAHDSGQFLYHFSEASQVNHWMPCSRALGSGNAGHDHGARLKGWHRSGTLYAF
jgi:uncharacterized cupredoxin-like copper-binding protein